LRICTRKEERRRRRRRTGVGVGVGVVINYYLMSKNTAFRSHCPKKKKKKKYADSCHTFFPARSEKKITVDAIKNDTTDREKERSQTHIFYAQQTHRINTYQLYKK
jgi:hypothetical protein